jgi:hypothetical protein
VEALSITDIIPALVESVIQTETATTDISIIKKAGNQAFSVLVASLVVNHDYPTASRKQI